MNTKIPQKPRESPFVQIPTRERAFEALKIQLGNPS